MVKEIGWVLETIQGCQPLLALLQKDHFANTYRLQPHGYSFLGFGCFEGCNYFIYFLLPDILQMLNMSMFELGWLCS